jgi:hypothetical protein
MKMRTRRASATERWQRKRWTPKTIITSMTTPFPYFAWWFLVHIPTYFIDSLDSMTRGPVWMLILVQFRALSFSAINSLDLYNGWKKDKLKRQPIKKPYHRYHCTLRLEASCWTRCLRLSPWPVFERSRTSEVSRGHTGQLRCHNWMNFGIPTSEEWLVHKSTCASVQPE